MWIVVRHAEKKKLTEIRRLFDAPEPDKHSILKALIDPNDDKPICKGGTGIRVCSKLCSHGLIFVFPPAILINTKLNGHIIR